jgi:hypothetical protein
MTDPAVRAAVATVLVIAAIIWLGVLVKVMTR